MALPTAAPQNHQPPQATTVVVPHQQTTVLQSGGCNCGVPANASTPVKATRGAAIAVIIIHAIALASFGFLLVAQWFASLMGIIAGGVLLCMFTKCAYTTGAVLFAVAAICDIVAMSQWISYANSIDEDDYYRDDDYESTVGWLALPPALGAIALILGSVSGFIAICKWHESGAPDVTPQMPSQPPVVTAQQVPPQQTQYQYPQSSQKGPPPSYYPQTGQV